jgi:hypothetical protein
VVLALVDWGLAHIPGTQRADALAAPTIEEALAEVAHD